MNATTKRMKIMLPFRDRFAYGCVMAALISILIRITIKDGCIASAIIFYALPLIITGGLLVVAACIWMSRRKWVRAMLVMVSGLACVVFWLRTNNYQGEPDTGISDPVRLLFWNAGRVRGDLTNAAESLLAENADIIALVESGDFAHRDRAMPRLPDDVHIAGLGGGLTVIARGAITNIHFVKFGYRNRIGTCTVQLTNGPMPLMVVDLDSNPFASRKSAMEMVVEMRSRFEPAVILGDFNTPTDSIWFNPLRAEYAESMEAGGTGLHATWPGCLPFLAIDHIWVHRMLRVHSSRIKFNPNSDHRMVIVDIN